MTLKGHAERRVLFCTFSESTKAVSRFGLAYCFGFSTRRSLGRLSLHPVRLRRNESELEREQKFLVVKNFFLTCFSTKSSRIPKAEPLALTATSETSLKLDTVSRFGLVRSYRFSTRKSFVLTHSFVAKNNKNSEDTEYFFGHRVRESGLNRFPHPQTFSFY